MAKKNEILVKDVVIKTMTKDGFDYICITDIARQKTLQSRKMLLKIGCAKRTHWSIWDFGRN